MIIIVKYFYEKTDTDYKTYNKLWIENRENMIYFPIELPLSKQTDFLTNNIMNDITNNKDILAVRFPSNNDIKQNKIINDFISGKGFKYNDNNIWYPKEVWIYNPINY